MGLPIRGIRALQEGVGYSEAQINDVPLLTPLPVLETRYSEQFDFSLIVIQLPNGRKALYVPGCVVDELTARRYACASTSMPIFLSEHEIDAIRKGSVFVGMSEAALYMSVGFPQHSNRAVVGLTQLVYHTMFVYLRDGNVAEIQDRN